jgi:hypothetical protein
MKPTEMDEGLCVTVSANWVGVKKRANEWTMSGGKKTIMPADVFRALDDIEYGFMREKLEAEFASQFFFLLLLFPLLLYLTQFYKGGREPNRGKILCRIQRSPINQALRLPEEGVGRQEGGKG